MMAWTGKHARGLAAGSLLAAITVFGFSPAAAAEYRLQPGDVIQIAVAGLPEMNQRLPVQLDGSVMIPHVGTLVVEGTPIASVRSSIQSTIASRLLRMPGPDGREIMRTVERQDVAVSIAEFRPIWVSGDVAQPGEKPFQPRMTVRQAIASAGGMRSPITRSSGPTYDPVALKDEFVSRWLSLAAHAARHWRLRTELGGDSEFDARTLPPSPLPGDPLSRILANEERIRELRELDAEREAEFLTRAAELAEEQIASLAEQLALEEQGEADDQAEYDRAKDLLNKGRLTNTSVVDARRSLLFSATRRLQTANDLMRVRRNLSEYRRELQRISDHRRLEILEELQAAELKLAEERSRLQGVQEKLALAGMAVPGSAEPSGKADVTVIRHGPEGTRAISAGYDDEVMPGDVVEVTLGRGQASAGDDDRSAPSGVSQLTQRTD